MKIGRNAGFTLIEILVAVGIMSGLTLVLAEVLTTIKKNTKRAELRDAINQDHIDFETLLMNRDACTSTFGPAGSLATATPTTPVNVGTIFNAATPAVAVIVPSATAYLPLLTPVASAQYVLLSVGVIGFNVIPNTFDASFRYQILNAEIRPRDVYKTVRFQANFSGGNVVLSCSNEKSNDYDVLYLNTTGNETKESNLDIRGRLHVETTAAADSGAVYARNFLTNSDAGKKEKVKTVKRSLRLITQLNGVEFDWLQGGQHDWGVIAQQVQKVIPALVTDFGGPSGLTVNYNGLIALSVEGLKELKNEKEALDAEVKSLEKTFEDLQLKSCQQGSFCHD